MTHEGEPGEADQNEERLAGTFSAAKETAREVIQKHFVGVDEDGIRSQWETLRADPAMREVEARLRRDLEETGNVLTGVGGVDDRLDRAIEEALIESTKETPEA